VAKDEIWNILEDRTWGVEATNFYFRTRTKFKYVTFPRYLSVFILHVFLSVGRLFILGWIFIYSVLLIGSTFVLTWVMFVMLPLIYWIFLILRRPFF